MFRRAVLQLVLIGVHFFLFSTDLSSSPCGLELIRLRFTKPIDQIAPIMTLRPTKDMAEEAMEVDTRNQSLRLEALFGLYQTIYGDLPWASLKTNIRKFESALGKLGARDEYVEFGISLGIPRSVDAILRKKWIQARDKFVETYESEGFNIFKPNNQWILLNSETFAFNFRNFEEDRENIRKAIVFELRRLSKLEFDMNSLEDIHEMRRRARWIVLYILALDGLIVLDQSDVDPDIQRFSRKLFNLPRNSLINSPLVLGSTIYQELLMFLKQVGALKDYGEGIEEVAIAYVEAGEAPSKTDAIEILTRKAKAKGVYIDIHKEGERLRQHAIVSRLFDRLADQLESQ